MLQRPCGERFRGRKALRRNERPIRQTRDTL
jgi:hypothetical protein